MTDSDKRVKVWWIDDDHADKKGPRHGELSALEAEADNALNLVPIHPAEFPDFLSDLSIEAAPDLLLIDFRLNNQKHTDKETPFFARDGVTLRGTTLGDSRLKDVPAYLVSGVTRESQIGSSDDYFDWVLSHQQLIGGNGGKVLWADASDYKHLREQDAAASAFDDPNLTQQALVTAICDLLNVPDASLFALEDLTQQTINSVLRSQSQLDTEDMKLAPSRPRAVAAWVRSTLQRIRGPLIDDIAAATILGATPDYFKTELKRRLNLEGVEYTGVFRRTASMTLWRQALLQCLESLSDTIHLSPAATLAKSAAAHFGIPENQRSTCRVCNKPWPEAIAFDEDDRTVDAAVHWRCSNEAVHIDSVLGFDVPRSFRE